MGGRLSGSNRFLLNHGQTFNNPTCQRWPPIFWPRYTGRGTVPRVALRGCFLSVESRRKSWAGRSQWGGQDNTLPYGGRRGNSRRGRRLSPQEVDDRLLSPGRRGNAGPFGSG